MMTVFVACFGRIVSPLLGSSGSRYAVLPQQAMREAAGVAAGDEIEVQIELDTAPREVVVPGDLAAALNECASAGECFDRLSYSNQRRHVLAIEAAKTAETRQRRIAKAVQALAAG